ncbi:transketolase [Streptomyces sp. NPDC058755]|uniref:transketolase n=1 Tax=Streptomyces sp. NPDC058755 TaxID=3346624 RepID=UPI0036CBD99F
MAVSGRDAFRSELTSIAHRDGRVVCLEAWSLYRDHPFEAAHPDRFFSLPAGGPVLAQMVTGLVAAGFRPFVVVGPGGTAPGRAVGNRWLWRACVEAGATVVLPPEGSGEGSVEVRQKTCVPLCAPCGEEETRAVVRQVARSRRPYCLVLGDGPGPSWPYRPNGTGDEVPLVAQESGVLARTGARLVSVGEAGTRLALAARATAPGLGHAHLVYLDEVRLAAAAAELASWPGPSVVTAAAWMLEEVLRALRARTPGHAVSGVLAPSREGQADVAGVLAAVAAFKGP